MKQQNNKPPKLSKEQQQAMLEASKKQRNLSDLQNMVQKLMNKLDALAYKIENTKDTKKKKELEATFDKKMSLIISLQQGNYSIETH